MSETVIGDLGPCEVWFDDTKVGVTFGDVLFKSEAQSVPVMEDGQGVTPVDDIVTGRIVTVEVPFTRATLAQLAVIIPENTQAADILRVDNPVAHSLAGDAAELVLKRIIDGAVSTDDTEYLTIFSAAPIETFEVPFNNSTQRVFKVTFKAYPDTTSGNAGRLYSIGA